MPSPLRLGVLTDSENWKVLVEAGRRLDYWTTLTMLHCQTFSNIVCISGYDDDKNASLFLGQEHVMIS